MMDKGTNTSLKQTLTLITDDQNQIILFVNYVILSGVVCLFGSVANVINMVVFYRQGLDTTINISFFSLAVSDLFSLIFQQLFNVYVNPLFLDLKLPIVHTYLRFVTISLTREVFARITCLITALITAERCLCVVFPLHIKRLITPRITTTIIIVIYTFTLLCPVHIYCTSYLTWKFYPDSNKTLLGLAFSRHYSAAAAMAYFTHAFFTLFGFMSVMSFTLILIYKLGQKSAWRQTANVDQEKAKSMSKRDRATITMVVLIAGTLVVCYAPAVMLCMTTFLVQEFTVRGRFSNVYQSCWSISKLCVDVNSSVNIILYYRMSSKYRGTFRELFLKSQVGDKSCVDEY